MLILRNTKNMAVQFTCVHLHMTLGEDFWSQAIMVAGVSTLKASC